MIDQKDLSKKDPVKIANTIQKESSPWSLVDDTFMIHSFGHLDGYSALYYTYMWSLVIAKDIFAEIEGGETTAKQTKLAKKYMKDILMPGGSKSANAMVENFLGRPFNAERFESWLKK